jgi:hypothetical protein
VLTVVAPPDAPPVLALDPPLPTCPPVLAALVPPDGRPALGLDPPLPLFGALLDEQAAASIASAATPSFCEHALRIINFSFVFLRGAYGLSWTGS